MELCKTVHTPNCLPKNNFKRKIAADNHSLYYK